MKVAVYQEPNNSKLFFMKNGSDGGVLGHFLGYVELEEVEEIIPIASKWDVKPPIGLKPNHIHRLERLAEIESAIKRYKDAGKYVPQGWLFEKMDLEMKIKAREDIGYSIYDENPLASKVKEPVLVEKKAVALVTNPNYEKGVQYITYELPICAVDVVAPSYKIKE